ncbi:MAG: hypothetical protein Q4P08_04835 [Eubacteriales bacterium]|nr:hypothetical protein [Eubacteriales bacterium]
MISTIEVYPETKAEWNLLREYGRDRIRIHRLEAFDTFIDVHEFGAALTSFFHSGQQAIVAYADPFAYLAPETDYLGVCLTPFAGRLNTEGEAVQNYLCGIDLPPLLLHSGEQGGARRFWDLVEQSGNSMTLAYTVEDGADGFCGKRRFSVRYALTGPGELELYLRCESDRETIANIGFHPYFNLSKYPDINLHELRIYAEEIYLTDERMLPKWECRYPTQGSMLDFCPRSKCRKQLQQSLKYARSQAGEKPAAEQADESPEQAEIRASLAQFAGLDHYFITQPKPQEAESEKGELRRQVRVYAPDTQSILELLSDAPGVVVYSGQHCGKYEEVPKPRDLNANRLVTAYCALAIEPQMVPDGPNNPELLQDYIVSPEKPQERRIIYRLTPPEDLRHGPDTADFKIFDDPLA